MKNILKFRSDLVYVWTRFCLVTHPSITQPLQISAFPFNITLTKTTKSLRLNIFDEILECVILKTDSSSFPSIFAPDCRIIAIPTSSISTFCSQYSDNVAESPSRSLGSLIPLRKEVQMFDETVSFPGFRDLGNTLKRIISIPPFPVVLYGLPGSGKTWLLKQIGSSYLGPSFFLDVSDLIQSRIGESEQLFSKIKHMLEYFSEREFNEDEGYLHPLLVIDSIEQFWNDGGQSSMSNLSVLFSQWINLDPHISIIAASSTFNISEKINTLCFQLGIPDFEDRLDILTRLFSKHDISSNEISQFASETHGCLPCDLVSFHSSKLLSLPFPGPFLLRDMGSSRFPPLYIFPTNIPSSPKVNNPMYESFRSNFSWIKTYFSITNESAISFDLPSFFLLYDHYGKHRMSFVSWLSSYTHQEFLVLRNSLSLENNIYALSFLSKRYISVFSVHSGLLFHKGIGDTDKAITSLFDRLALFRPCIICIEDVDAILSRLSIHLPFPDICVIGLSADPRRISKSKSNDVSFQILIQH